MFVDFTIAEQGRFERRHTLPDNYRGPVLVGSTVETAVHPDFGVLISQHLQTNDFSIHFSSYDLIKPVTLYCYQSAAMLVSILSLKNTFRYFYQQTGKLKLKQSQFALLHNQETQPVTAQFNKASQYQSLEIAWSEKMIINEVGSHPLVESLFGAVKSFFLGNPGKRAGQHALDIANQIIRSPYDEENSLPLFYQQVQEYLMFLFVESGSNSPIEIRLTEEERKRVMDLAVTISQHKTQRFPIDDLAKEMGMNETKLQNAFKQVHGSSIYQYQLNERMTEAHLLLQQPGRSIKEISVISGYRHSTHFIKKFKEHFGYNPSQVRKRR